MIKQITLITAIALAPSAVLAQDSDADRARAIREQIRELNQELRELSGSTWNNVFVNPGNSFGAIQFGDRRARMGVEVNTRRNAATDSIGAVIAEVERGSAAAEAGLQDGDIVTSFGGERLVGRYPPASDFESEPAVKLIDLVKEYEPGDVVSVEYVRNGRRATTDIELQEAGDMAFSLRSVSPGGFSVGTGSTVPFSDNLDIVSPTIWMFSAIGDLELVEMNEDLSSYFGTEEGVLVIETPEDNSLNLRGGDVILNIGGRVTDEPSRVFRILGTYDTGESVRFEVMRQGQRETVTGNIPERRGGSIHFGREDR